MFSHKLLPDTSFGRDTKSFTSCDFTLVNTPLVTDSFCFSCHFFLCQTEQFTPIRNCSDSMNDLEQELCVRSIRIEVCGVSAILSFSEFHDLKR